MRAKLLMCTHVAVDQVQWGALCECLPWEEGERADELRRLGHNKLMKTNFIILREMWSLFNLDDTKSLRISDLVQGVTSVCQLDNQEFFDFYPAVRFVKTL